MAGGFNSADGSSKFIFKDAASMTLLAWGVLEFSEGYHFANELTNALDIIEHGLNFWVKCWIPASGENVNSIVAHIAEEIKYKD